MNVFRKFTVESLKKNKTRTLVTIIGIILSVAMFTAVTTSISTLQNFMKNAARIEDGDWHGVYYDMDKEAFEKLSANEKVQNSFYLQNIGYSKLFGQKNKTKPYLFVGGMGEGFSEKMPINMLEGRLPENSNEIIIPKTLKTIENFEVSLGETLRLSIGERSLGGEALGQKNDYFDEEAYNKLYEKEYTVVGIYNSTALESSRSPGYAALTGALTDENLKYDAYFSLKSPSHIYAFGKENFSDLDFSTNSQYLMYHGVSDDKNFMSTFVGLAAILIGVIMLGSISLIYNSFSISVSERTKQFGLLASIGATKKQLQKSVLFEALVLGLIAIPLGVLAGLIGMFITFNVTDDMFSSFYAGSADLAFEFSASLAAIAAASVIGFITLIISAYIPAKRAVKMDAIEAIRQANDIKVNAGDVKLSRLTTRIFGFEGMIAAKNFKRNKKRYRSTVISLFMSIILFISATGFTAYLKKGADELIENVNFDILYFSYNDSDNDNTKKHLEIHNSMSSVEGVSESAYYYMFHDTTEVDKNCLNNDYVTFVDMMIAENATGSLLSPEKLATSIIFIDDVTYKKYLEENSLEPSIFMNKTEPRALAYDFIKFKSDNRYYTFNIFEKTSFSLTALNSEPADTEFSIGGVTKKLPFCVDGNRGLTLMYPESAMNEVISRSGLQCVSNVSTFNAENPSAVFDEMQKIIDREGVALGHSQGISNYAEETKMHRTLVTVVNIFSYGFISLITLIATANVFNTISTNIGLRRREMAMLKSVGMTNRAFNKMMNFECLLYGIKALLWGIPTSLSINYLIYISMRKVFEVEYIFPLIGIFGASASVFMVVFGAMIYSMRKIKKENTIDALKNENS